MCVGGWGVGGGPFPQPWPGRGGPQTSVTCHQLGGKRAIRRKLSFQSTDKSHHGANRAEEQRAKRVIRQWDRLAL